MTAQEAKELPLPVRLQLSRHGVTFYACIMECFDVPELIENFDRLWGCNLCQKGAPINLMVDKATGRMQHDMKEFVEFVWEYVFLRFGENENNKEEDYAR